MTHTRRAKATSFTHRHKAKLRKPTSRELDLLLLAGCSCLMTVLYHPVAEALQTTQATASNAQSAIAIQTSRSTSTTMNCFHLVLPPARENGKEEEDKNA
jgi:hypothetical protein